MNNTPLAKSPRIEVVDALRGFAVMAIMLLHNIEHFNFYDFPAASSAFMQAMDKGIWETLFFLFSGKAYAIFSLLFGFSFFIQYNNQARKGEDFRLRFLWRLFLLFIIGCFNGAFFPGDILVLYSIIGVVLVLVCKWSDRAVLVAAVILMLQPLELGKFFYAMMNPDYVPAAGVWRIHSQRMYPFLSQPDFWARRSMWRTHLASGWMNGRMRPVSPEHMRQMLKKYLPPEICAEGSLWSYGPSGREEKRRGKWMKASLGTPDCRYSKGFLSSVENGS